MMPGQFSGNKKIAKNTIALYIRMGVTMLITFFTTRITLEILGVDDYGLNNVVASVVSMLGFLNGSMGSAVQRFFSVEIGKNNQVNLARVFGTGLYLHTIVAVITFIFAELFAIFFLSKLNIPTDRLVAAKFVFQISIVSFVLNILNVPFQALLKAHEEFTKIAVLDVISAVLRLAVLFLLYDIKYDKLVALSLLNFAVTLTNISIIVVFAKKHDEVKFKLLRDRALVKKMLSFISMLIFTVLASVLNKQGIVIIVNLFFGLTINAAYAVASQVSHMLETFAMNFKQAVVPQLMQAYATNDMSRMNKLIFLGTKVTFLLMMLISIPIIVEAEYILKIWLKEPPDHASVFTILIVIGVNINTFYYFIYQAVHASGRIKKQQILTSISYIVSIGIIYLLFKQGASYYYAAIIPIIFSIIRNIIVIYNAIDTINLNVKHFVTSVILPCMVMALILSVLPFIFTFIIDISLLRFLLILSVNAILVVILGFFIVLDNEERTVLLVALRTNLRQKVKLHH